ncbi:MAG: nuclear transport factor 2 family protein [Pseudomonadota bacterium]
MSEQSQQNLVAAKSFVASVEAMDGSLMDRFFATDVEQIEWPNLFKPGGERRDLAALKADIEKAKGVMHGQRYEIKREIASNDCVVLEMVWSGVAVKEIGPLQKGQKLNAHCVAVFDFENGQVVGLRNYDCFDPV